DACFESPLLLLVAHLKPILDQADAVVDDLLLKGWANLQEPPVLLLSAKPHHIFNACTVVPTAIEDHDLSGCREMREITLHVHLGFFSVGRRRQRHETERARADTLGDRLDRSALASGIATLEHDDDPLAGLLDPLLQRAQLRLQPAQGLFVLLTLEFRSLGLGLRTIRFVVQKRAFLPHYASPSAV